tara:strand:+ start:108 stop:629 length:522 start_codon:yes stop_codon:yes gene_type:complete
MSTLKVDTIEGKTTSGTVKFPSENIVQVIKTDDFSTTSETFTNITGLGATITPKYNTSKILVLIQCCGGIESNGSYLRLQRGGSNVALLGDSGGPVQCTAVIPRASGGEAVTTTNILFLDSPTTTSATTYQVQVRKRSSSGSAFNLNINQDGNTGSSDKPRASSSIIVMEIQQ